MSGTMGRGYWSLGGRVGGHRRPGSCGQPPGRRLHTVVGWDQLWAFSGTGCHSGHLPPPTPGAPQSPHCDWAHPRRQAGWLHTSEGQRPSLSWWGCMEGGAPTFTETPSSQFQGAPSKVSGGHHQTGSGQLAMAALCPAWVSATQPLNGTQGRVFLCPPTCGEAEWTRSGKGI